MGRAAEKSGVWGTAETHGSVADDYKVYSIGDLAREFDVTLRTLRFYEDRGLLKPRRHGMTRLYDAKDRARLATILKGKQLGFTLTEISAMIDAQEGSGLNMSLSQIDEQIELLERQKSEIDEAIKELRDSRKKMAVQHQQVAAE
jgi:DNA-binding transcriptional MerR regulator